MKATLEMIAAGAEAARKYIEETGGNSPAVIWDAMWAAKPAQQQEPTVEDNSQKWRGMDGATAYWLIQRHADGWADVNKMMGEWLAANHPEQQQEPVGEIGKIVMFGGDLKEVSWKNGKMPPVGSILYTSPPASKPLTDELDVLRAVSAEYNAWIRYHAGGGSYDDFLQRELAAIKGKV